MLEMHETKILDIPDSISPEVVIDSLKSGHGYDIRVLTLGSRGMTRCVPPNDVLPELIIIGNAILLNDSSGDARRLEDLLRVLKGRWTK